MDVRMEIKILNPTEMGMMMGMVIEIINEDEDRKSKIMPKSDLDRNFTPWVKRSTNTCSFLP